MQGELSSNQKVFDNEIDTLRQLLQKKTKQLEALAIADKKTDRGNAEGTLKDAK